MVYKFHEDAHGEVVAESVVPELEPMMGLHFPATDIPQAMRQIFKTMRSRMIVDAQAQPAHMVNTDEIAEQPVLQAHSQLRGVAGCHAQASALAWTLNPV